MSFTCQKFTFTCFLFTSTQCYTISAKDRQGPAFRFLCEKGRYYAELCGLHLAGKGLHQPLLHASALRL